MKRHERTLFNHLQTSSSSTDLLPNVRKAMGQIGDTQGNPLSKTEITLDISTYFSLGGVTIDPSDPVLIPWHNQIPLYLFGLTDYYAGYAAARKLVPFTPPWYQNSQLVGEPAVGIFGNTRSNALSANTNAQQGDMIISWGGGAFGALCCDVVIHCNNVAYGTFLNSFASDLITLEMIRYIVPIADIAQFTNPFVFGYQTLFGKLSSDSIDPRMYVTPKDFQQQISDIPLHLPIDKNLILCTNIFVDVRRFQIILFVEKVEPLTHK
jgi:hypothetical protein